MAIYNKGTLDNLVVSLQKKFSAHKSAIDTAFKAAEVSDKKIKLYTTTGKTDTPVELDMPVEYFLDQTKTVFVSTFAFSDATYPGATDPSLDGKPVLVLAVKGDNSTVTYSFIDLTTLLQKISTAEGNQLELKSDGWYVKATDLAIEDATTGDIVTFGADGALTDSGRLLSSVLTIDDVSATVSVATFDTLLAGTEVSEWAASTSYDADDYVIYEGELYKANSAHTSGASFEAANWTKVE